MSNRRDRRKAAAIKRHAKPATPVERRQLIVRVAVVIAALIAGAALLTLLR
jgi:hypothetical protein